jgi:hypothetical protein
LTPGPVLTWATARHATVSAALEAGAARIGSAGLDPATERLAALAAFRLWRRLADALDPAAADDRLDALFGEAGALSGS